MKKTIKLICSFALILMMLMVSGCNSAKKLDKAISALETTNYTLESNMEINMTIKYNGQSQSNKVTTGVYVEADPNNIYTVATAEGIKTYSYVAMEGDQVKVYSKTNSAWQLLETISTNDYVNDYTDFVEVETEDCFKLEDGVWVGDVEKITEQMKPALDKISKEYAQSGVSIKSVKIDKYNITIDGKKLEKIDIVISMSMESNGTEVSMSMSMPMVFSKIGDTKVTVPEGLPK